MVTQRQIIHLNLQGVTFDFLTPFAARLQLCSLCAALIVGGEQTAFLSEANTIQMLTTFLVRDVITPWGKQKFVSTSV